VSGYSPGILSEPIRNCSVCGGADIVSRDPLVERVDGFPFLLPWEPEELIARNRDMMAIVTAVGFDELDLVIDGPAVELTGPSGQSLWG